MEDILPTIPVNTSIDSKIVLDLDAEFSSSMDGVTEILGQGTNINISINKNTYYFST